MGPKTIFFTTLIGLSSLANAQDASLMADTTNLSEVSKKEKKISLFESWVRDSIHEISIETNFDSLEFYKVNEIYQKAELTYTNDNDSVTRLDFKVRTRGKMRKRVCSFASLKLKFKKAHLKEMGLSKENKYKLVCQCKPGKKAEQLLLKEYLGYRFYNLLSEDSYKTHLLRIRYVDTSDGSIKVRYGILLEEEDAFAERRGGRVLERPDFIIENVSRDHLAKISIFQYMIGNTDWSLNFLHNLKIISTPDSNVIVPVPYDFDYTGLVNAHYAIPGESLGIKSVRERYFLGPCRIKNLHIKAIGELESIRGEIEEMIRAFDYLDEEARLDMIEYLESFFNAAEKEKFIEREITTTCR